MGVKERREREENARLAAILEAAERVFVERGFHHTRMDDIAEAAELAKGTLYYYFKSKDEIFLHLLERETGKVGEEIRRRVTAESTLIQTLETMLDLYVEYFDRNPSFLKIFLPCMGRFLKFENDDTVRRAARTFEAHGKYMRKALQAKIVRENVSVSVDQLLHFLKTLQLGLGLKLLEGRKDEARAAARFFLDLMSRIVKEKP